jgi:hypothetical protein
LKARLINYAFTDTTEANTQRISQYPGAMIYTTSGGDKLWLRSSDATLWTRVGSGSGGGGNGIVSLGASAYGLTIQNDSTYKVDTSKVSTKLWRQKGIDSVQANVNLKLNITDTSNKWITSVYRKTASDSVFYVKGGTATFAYKDSIGSGGGGGGVTTIATINGTTKSSNGAVISGANFYMQTVDGTYPGLMTSAQKARLDSNSYLTIDKRYDSLAWRRNDSTFLVKSLRVQAYGTTQTPTTTDSSISYNITKAPPTKQSVTSTSDTIHLVNDSTTFVGATKIYGYSGEVRGWKDALDMTLTSPQTGEVIMYSAGALVNGRKVDTIYRTAGKDSIIFNIAGVRRAIKDSTGGGGGTPGGSTTQVQYNNAGAFAGSANMTFDGTQLYLVGSQTQSPLRAGTIELQSYLLNNAWVGENVYYNAGWKARQTGYTPMIYFNGGGIEFQTVSSTVSAGSATTPLTRMYIHSNGKVAIGPGASSLSPPTAYLHFTNGTTVAGNAPLKFYLTGAGILSTPEAGAMEFKVDTVYYTGENSNRRQLTPSIYGSATLDFGSTAAQTSSDLTIVNVTGAADGDIVSVGMPNASTNTNSCYTAWVSAANTVTVRFNNYSSGAIDPASGTFKVRVFK